MEYVHLSATHQFSTVHPIIHLLTTGVHKSALERCIQKFQYSENICYKPKYTSMRFDATQDNKLQEFGAKSTALLGGLHPRPACLPLHCRALTLQLTLLRFATKTMNQINRVSYMLLFLHVDVICCTISA